LAIVETAHDPALFASGAVAALSRLVHFLRSWGFRENEKFQTITKLIWDEAHWKRRAEEARTIREAIRRSDCKRIMRDMAKSYDRLASLTEAFKTAAAQPMRRVHKH